MKRLIVITGVISVIIVAAWVIFDVFASSPSETNNDNTPIEVHDETDEMLKTSESADMAVPAAGMDVKIAPVFDNTGAVVSDPTGTLLNANHSGDLTASRTRRR